MRMTPAGSAGEEDADTVFRVWGDPVRLDPVRSVLFWSGCTRVNCRSEPQSETHKDEASLRSSVASSRLSSSNTETQRASGKCFTIKAARRISGKFHYTQRTTFRDNISQSETPRFRKMLHIKINVHKHTFVNLYCSTVHMNSTL